MTKNKITNKFNDFVNNVFCRNEINQHKAAKLWKELKETLPDCVSISFETEWNHYIMGEFDSDKFGIDIKTLKRYFIG